MLPLISACICSDGTYGPEGSRILNDRCYMKDPVMRTWFQADANCASNNMNLADFSTQQEYDDIISILGKWFKISSSLHYFTFLFFFRCQPLHVQ
jgi:hypothetical protein